MAATCALEVEGWLLVYIHADLLLLSLAACHSVARQHWLCLRNHWFDFVLRRNFLEGALVAWSRQNRFCCLLRDTVVLLHKVIWLDSTASWIGGLTRNHWGCSFPEKARFFTWADGRSVALLWGQVWLRLSVLFAYKITMRNYTWIFIPWKVWLWGLISFALIIILRGFVTIVDSAVTTQLLEEIFDFHVPIFWSLWFERQACTVRSVVDCADWFTRTLLL